MKTFFTILSVIFCLILLGATAWGQTTVFSDDFSANQSSSYTTSGAIGSSAWSVSRSGDDWGARRNTTGIMEVTNDVSATGNASGWAFSSVSLSTSFSSPFNATLSSNAGVVTWTFNMRTNRTTILSGFGSTTTYGLAFVLVGTSTSANTSGSGYAVVMGSASTDSNKVRLVSYNNGLQGTLTTIVGPGGKPTAVTDYRSIKVTYDPSSNQWELFNRDDGSSAFTDPTTGTLTSLGTGTNSTYTGTGMSYTGAFWQGSTLASQTTFFDNYKVTIASYEPTTQASSITFSSVSSNAMTVSWTNGNGANRLVLAHSGSAVDANPVDFTSYTANAAFGSGTQIGTGNYVVYSGNSNSVAVTGLSASTTYYFRVYEYNSSGTQADFDTASATNNPNSQATSAGGTPTINVTGTLNNFGTVVAGSNSSQQSYTVSGSSLTADITITAPSGFQVSTTSGSNFGSSVTLTQSGGTVSSTTIYARFSPSSADGAESGNITHTSTGATTQNQAVAGTAVSTEPSTQSSIAFGSVTNSSIVVNFSGGNGSNRIVVARSGNAVSYSPTDGAASSGVNSDFSSATDQGSGNKIMYDGTGSTVTVTGLTGHTTYYFAVYEYNVGTGTSQNYNTTSPGTGNQATLTTVYTWNQSNNSASWATSSNWTPTRTSASSTDSLVFNNGGNDTITSVPTETVGQIYVSGSTKVYLQASGANTLTINGGTSTDLSVASGSEFNINGSSALSLTLATGATGSISGNMTFSNAGHSFIVTDASAVTFNSGAVFTQGTGSSGSVFGTTGNANAVTFANGSSFISKAGNNPFGLGQPSSRVVFQTGSLYSHQQSGTPSFSGRTYANFELNASGQTISTTGGAAFSIDNITLTDGTLNIGMTGTFNLKGNISAASGKTLTFNAASASSITFNGTSAQSINGPGTITFNPTENITLNNSNGLTINQNVRFQKNLTLTSGIITTGSDTLTVDSAVTRTIGFVAGYLKKPVATGGTTVAFEVGDASNYRPVSISFGNVTVGGSLTANVSQSAGDHPNIGTSGLNSAKSVNRYWTVSNTGTTFNNYSATFTFVGSDTDAASNTANYVVKKYDSGTWSSTTTGTRTSTSTQASGMTSFSDYAVAELLPPTITVTGTLSDFGIVGVGATSSSQSYTVSGSYLTADITITAPTDFQVSTSSNSGFGSSVTLTQSGGSVGNTTIYARFAPGSTGAKSGNITHTSSGATTQNQAVSGTAISAEPTQQDSTITFSSVGTSSITVNWVNGDAANRIVVAKSGSSVSFSPTDATASSGVNSDFSSATDQGSGNKIVYDGTGSTVTVTGLNPATTYYFRVYGYNGTGTTVNYLTNTATGNPNNQTTLSSEPTLQDSTITFSSISASSMTVSWLNGDGANHIVVAKASGAIGGTPTDGSTYSANSTFGSGGTIAANEYVVYNGTGTSVVVTGLSASTTYYFRVFGYSGSSSTSNYLTNTATGNPNNQATLASEPTTQASNITFSDRMDVSMKVKWTNGNGGFRIVVAKAGSAITDTVVDGTSYTADSAFGSGNTIGTGEYVVYKGTADSVIVTGLTASTTYYYRVFEYNMASPENYLTSTASGNPNSATTLATEPTTASSSISFTGVTGNAMTVNWTNGDGANRIVVAKSGSAVSGSPTDGGGYTADSVFSGGNTIAAGEYVVYNGSGTSVRVTSLSSSTTYHFAVFEYNGSGTSANYLTSSSLTGNQTTLTTGAPTVTTPTATNINSTSATLGANVTSDGNDPIVERGVVWSTSSNPTTADNKVSTAGTTGVFTVGVSGLPSATLIHYRGYAINSIDTAYTTDATFSTHASEPTSQDSTITFSSIGANSMTVSWMNGNGANRIVVAKSGSAVSGSPTDGSGYSADTVFGSGNTIAANEYVVYNGSGSTVTITGLNTSTTYHFRAFGYNGSGVTTNYLTASATGNPNSQETLAPEPTVPATNIVFSNRTNTSVKLKWTSGNGASRLVVGRAGIDVSGSPTDGTSYAADSVFGAGGTIATGEYVLYNGTADSVTITGLSPETNYRFMVFEYNMASPENYLPNNAAGNPDSIYTFATEPTAHAGSFAASATSASSINLTWTVASGADGYIILKRTSSDPTGTPSDGTGYSAGNTIGDGTVAAVITSGAATSTTISGLAGNTSFHFSIMPFAWDGVHNATYNYKTDGSIPTANALTFSSSSDVIATGGFSYPANVAYATYQENTNLTAGNSLAVFGVTVRDGGGVADADNVPTILTAISFNVTNVGFLRRAALYDGATELAEVAVSGSPITFSGLNDTTADGSSKDLVLRVSYTTSVTDNAQYTFTVSSVTASPSGSGFASANGGGATSSTSGDNNRIEVTATTLAFTTQPQSGILFNQNFGPVAVTARDVNGNTDLDYGSVTLSSATFTLSSTDAGGLTQTASSGVASWTNLSSSNSGTGTILANGTGASGTSNTITVTDNNINSAQNGNWSDTSTWVGHVVPTSSQNATINHTVTLTGATSITNITVNNGGILDAGANILTVSGTFSLNGGSEFRQGGTVQAVPGATRSFATTSTYRFNGTQGGTGNFAYPAFGNLIWEPTPSANGTFQNSDTSSPFNRGLVVHGNLTLNMSSSLEVRLATGATFSRSHTVDGNLTIQGGTLVLANGSTNGTLTVGGNINVSNSGILRGVNSSGNGILNLKGSISKSSIFTHGGGSGAVTVTMNGTSSQDIGGSTNDTLQNLTINNSAGVTLSREVDVTGTLTFTNGNVTTGSNVLYVTSTATISRTSGHIIGNEQLDFPSGDDIPAKFDVGSSSGYTPVTLDLDGAGGTSGTFIASATGSSHAQISSSGLDTAKDINRYWTVTPGTGALGPRTYKLKVDFLSGDVGGANTNNFEFRKYNGSWSAPTGGTYTRTATSTQYDNFTSFSDFAVGEPRLYSLNVTIVGNGSVTKTPPTGPYTFGQTVTLNAIPDSGWSLSGWSGDASGSNNPLDVVMNADKNITATFVNIPSYTIAVTQHAHGTISPGTSIVAQDSSKTFTITPATGYHTDSVVVDGVNEGIITTRTFSSVNANHTITAYYSINMYTITVTQHANGTIAPGTSSVAYGDSITFTITPSTGYHTDSVVVDGANQGALASKKFTNVQANHTITAYYSINMYTITVTQHTNGTIAPGTSSVAYGDSITFTITPSAGYHVDSVVVDGVNQGVLASKKFTTVQAAHTLTAYYSLNSFTITVTQHPHGTIAPGTVSALYGSSKAFTITPASGYHVDSVMVDGNKTDSTTSYTFQNITSNHTITALYGLNPVSRSVSVARRWNMVSLPVKVNNKLKTADFPSAISFAYTYSNGYVQRDTLAVGVSYWMKFNGQENIPFNGIPQEDTISVHAGWNMIGSGTDDVPASVIQPVGTTIISQYYAYSNGYKTADTIRMGKGYWIKVSSSGKLAFSGSPYTKTIGVSESSLESSGSFNTLTITDAQGQSTKLYFGNNPKGTVSLDWYDLPPSPPIGVFDIRFSSQKLLGVVNDDEINDLPLQISGAVYPLEVKWSVVHPQFSTVLEGDNKETIMKGDGSVVLKNAAAPVAVKVVGLLAAPKEFSLALNYPNPFNPTTTIKYQLAAESKVSLRVYNELGQVIATLVDGTQAAGFRSIDWNAGNNASGVYFYRLEASDVAHPSRSFVQVRKMLLMK